MKKQYKPSSERRYNDLGKIPTRNTVKVVYHDYETIYENVHHTNSFVNTIVSSSNVSWKQIWVNETLVKWKEVQNNNIVIKP